MLNILTIEGCMLDLGLQFNFLIFKVMEAVILSVFKDKNYSVNYSHYSPKRFHDDIECCGGGEIYPPMMEVRFFREKRSVFGSLECYTVNVFADPEVVRLFTDTGLFCNNNDFCCFEAPYSIKVDVEWITGEYPYIGSFVKKDYRDEISTDVYKYLKVNKVYDVKTIVSDNYEALVRAFGLKR